jgi:large subunit ribosomal protein L13
LENAKTYEYHPNFKVNLDDFPEYKQKEEFSKIPFDPNIRHRLPEIPNHLMNKFWYGVEPEKEAQSSYVVVNHQGTTYHLFNA